MRVSVPAFVDQEHQRKSALELTVLLASVLYVVWRVMELARNKAYAIDEFLYAHKAWLATPTGGGLGALVRDGDTFMSWVVLLPPVWLADNNPANMLFVRLWMLPLLALTAGAVALIACRACSGRRVAPAVVALVALCLLLSTKKVIWHLIEIRPDCVAILFVTGSVAVLMTRLPVRARASLAGLLLCCATLSSKKVLVMGTAFALVFCLDLVAVARRRPAALGHPLWFAGSYLLGMACLVGYLAATDSFGSFWDGFYGRAALHEQFYPARDPTNDLKAFFATSTLTVVFALVGVIALGRRVLEVRREAGGVPTELLVLLLLPATWASYLLQKAAWAYSIIPGGVWVALLATIGVASVLDGLARAPFGRWSAGAALVLALSAAAVTTAYARYEPKHTVERQIELQRDIHALTSLDDAIYDMSATYAFRPHAHRFAFLDTSRKRAFKEELQEEVPRALIENQAVMWIYDGRFHGWRRTRLGRFLLENYQPYNDDLRLWGRNWTRNEAAWKDRFRAIKDGRYFVHPPEAAETGQLTVDGEAIDQPIIELTRGEHEITWTPGAVNPSKLYLIWLPRTGEPFDPTARHPRFYLGRYVLP